MDIRECLNRDDFKHAHPVVERLRPHLDEARYLEMMQAMRHEGYRAFLGTAEGRAVCYAGVIVRTNLYDHKHMWVDDLVTADADRSKGYGLAMLGYLEKIAAGQGCEHVSLSSGLQRADAHRFYSEKAGYERVSYVFRKRIDGV